MILSENRFSINAFWLFFRVFRRTVRFLHRREALFDLVQRQIERQAVEAAASQSQMFAEQKPIPRDPTVSPVIAERTLLADFGFAPRTAFVSELAERLRHKLLPTSPDTLDASELFMLAMPDEFDARWLHALEAPLLERIALLLTDGS